MSDEKNTGNRAIPADQLAARLIEAIDSMDASDDEKLAALDSIGRSLFYGSMNNE